MRVEFGAWLQAINSRETDIHDLRGMTQAHNALLATKLNPPRVRADTLPPLLRRMNEMSTRTEDMKLKNGAGLATFLIQAFECRR